MAPRGNRNRRAPVRYGSPDTLEPSPIKEIEPNEQPVSYYHYEPCTWSESPGLISQGKLYPALYLPTNGCIREAFSDSDEDELDVPLVMYADPNLHELPFVEPGAKEGNSTWCLEVTGPQSLPWFETIASIKMFAKDFPQILQICAIAEGTFLMRTNLNSREQACTRDLVKLIRHRLRGLKMITASDFCLKTVGQILWTRPRDMFL